MAKRKKSRTPAPPRRSASATQTPRPSVQAPKVRSGKRGRTTADADRRSRLILYAFGGSGIVGIAVALILILTAGGKHSSTSTAADNGPNVDFAALPGIRRTKAPWPAEYKDLEKRLPKLGLHPLSKEQLQIHIHQHLDIFVDGKSVTVPRFIGIDDNKFITELHTHDAQSESLPGTVYTPTGVIHEESASPGPYSLGQFFGVWGVFLSKKCIGGYCATPSKPLRFYVNGDLFKGNPVRLALEEHEEIAIVYGKPPSKIPSSFDFGPFL